MHSYGWILQISIAIFNLVINVHFVFIGIFYTAIFFSSKYHVSLFYFILLYDAFEKRINCTSIVGVIMIIIHNYTQIFTSCFCKKIFCGDEKIFLIMLIIILK